MIQGEHRVNIVDAIKLIRGFKGDVVVLAELWRGHEGTWVRVVKKDLIKQLKYSAEEEMMETGSISTRLTLNVPEHWDGRRMLLTRY